MKKIATALMLLAFLPRCAEKSEAQPSALQTLPSPASAGASAPFLSSTRDGALLSWIEPVAGSDRFAVRFARHRGGKWSAPRTIVARNDLFVNWADFPSIVEDAKGTLFAHWLQKSSEGTYSYDVKMATSRDGGATWSAPFLLNRDGVQSEHGFVSLAALPGGGVGAAWLDGRKMTGGEHGHGGGEMSIRYATVDAKGTIAADTELDGRTCECCNTGMAMTSRGPVIAYRDRGTDETRDIALVRRAGKAWSAPRRIRADSWKIDGCPVNGPQLDAIGDRVAAAWFTAAGEKQRVYAAFSDDAGVTFGNAIAIDDGKPVGRVDVVMLDDRTAVVAWLEQTARGAEIRARRITRGGKREASVKIADSATARAAGFTRIARVGNGVWFTWTEQSATSKRVHVARKQF